MKNVIFTTFEDKPESNGNINALAFFNDIDGTFIDAYSIENGLFAKRLIPKNKEVAKASFFAFLQSETEDSECWNTDCLPGEGEGYTFDEVDLGSVSSSGGSVAADYYTTLSYLNFINNTSGSDGGSSGRGGGNFNSVAGTILANPVEAMEGATIEENLNLLIENNPFLLLDVPCGQIQKWQTLAQHTAPKSVADKIKELPSSMTNDFRIQSLDDANGTIVNMDYFAINVITMPNKSNGQKFTADELQDYMRRNFNDFVDDSTFDPYCKIPSLCSQETDLWNSSDPTGALVYIDIPGDDGVVVCTEYKNDYWYFMTMNAPYAGNHPVSGTRQFGYETLANGLINFFVRGVDRFDSNLVENTLHALSLGNPFFGADSLWESFQEKFQNFVDNNGGNALATTPKKYRPDWKKVKDVLEGKKPISDLGCN